MFAIILDDNNYIKSYSERFRKPKSILVNKIPDEFDIEKLCCYQLIDGNFVFDAEKWASIESEREENAKKTEISDHIASLESEIKDIIEKSIECMISLLLVKTPPYDLKELYENYRSISAEIEDLRKQL